MNSEAEKLNEIIRKTSEISENMDDSRLEISCLDLHFVINKISEVGLI